MKTAAVAIHRPPAIVPPMDGATADHDIVDILPPIGEDMLVAELSRLGAHYDAHPAYPADSLHLLGEAGLLRRFAPVMAGGGDFADEGARHAAMAVALRRVGRGDLSVGRLFEGHVNALLLFGWYATRDQVAWLSHELDRDAVFGVWATEPAPGVALVGGNLVGSKSFASGAGGIDHAIITVKPEAGDRRLAIVRANIPDRADLGGWVVRGMRASMSGVYDVSGPPTALLGEPGDYDREPRFTAGAWRFTAVQLGGIEALLAETRAGLGEVARGDPLARAGFGQAIVATRSAGLWVRQAAALAAHEDADAPACARMTRGVVERAGLDVMEQAARLLGTRSAFTGQRADKIIRDLSLYLRQAGPDHARDSAVGDWLARDRWGEDRLW